jgi:hypothetical protein
MCFSKNVSLATFLTGIIGGLLCFSTGIPDYKIIGLFFMFVSLMQGIEYLIWSHQVCDDYNKNISYLGMILNHLQPVILFILLVVFSKEKFNKHKESLILLIVIYISVIVKYSLQFEKECILKDTKTNHLHYQWNSMEYNTIAYTLFLLCFIVFGLFFPNKQIGISFSILSIISYIISSFIYTNTPVVGSMWCFFASFAPMFFYILRKTKVV